MSLYLFLWLSPTNPFDHLYIPRLIPSYCFPNNPDIFSNSVCLLASQFSSLTSYFHRTDFPLIRNYNNPRYLLLDSQFFCGSFFCYNCLLQDSYASSSFLVTIIMLQVFFIVKFVLALLPCLCLNACVYSSSCQYRFLPHGLISPCFISLLIHFHLSLIYFICSIFRFPFYLSFFILQFLEIFALVHSFVLNINSKPYCTFPRRHHRCCTCLYLYFYIFFFVKILFVIAVLFFLLPVSI